RRRSTSHAGMGFTGARSTDRTGRSPVVAMPDVYIDITEAAAGLLESLAAPDNNRTTAAAVFFMIRFLLVGALQGASPAQGCLRRRCRPYARLAGGQPADHPLLDRSARERRDGWQAEISGARRMSFPRSPMWTCRAPSNGSGACSAFASEP